MGKKAWEVKYKDMIDEKDLTGIKNLRNMKSKYVVTRKKEGKVKDIKLKPLWKFLLHE